MEFYGYVGCFDEEQKIGGRFSITIDMLCEIGDAVKNDDLSQTINYQEVYVIVKALMQQPCRLLESKAQNIRETLLQRYPQIEQIKVAVSKLSPTLATGGKMAAVTVEM